MPRDRSLARAVHEQLLATDPATAGTSAAISAVVRREHPLLPDAQHDALVAAVAARATGLGALEPILADARVSELMVNGDGSVWVERDGALDRTTLLLERAEVELLIERIVGPLGLRADRSSPISDARLADGSRINVVVPPVAVDGPLLTIRRFGARTIPLRAFASDAIAALLEWAVAARCNVVVSGGTGAGKTTLLNALAACLPTGDRIVTVEDTAELRLPHPHVVRLEARPSTSDGLGAITTRDLVRNALRMRPDRIVVGEVRGPEALDMLWAMNTGQEGSLSTCHANSPADALRRLEVMVLSAGLDLPLHAVRDQLASAVDLDVQVARTSGGHRRVIAVGEVVDDPAGPARVRLIAGAEGVHHLPVRTRLASAPAPDPAWCR